MKSHDAVNIVFQYPLEADRVIPIDEAFAFADQENKLWQAGYVIWRDGSRSYAKSWWDSLTGKMVRIGAGAYGDLNVLERNFSELNS
jgi:hypothetical protein